MALPEILTVEDLFNSPVRAGASISPDGTRIAYLAPWKDRLNVWVHGVDSDDDAIMWTSPAVNRVASPHALSGGGSVMVVTSLGWWAWTACFFCLLATEIPTGTRAARAQGPGARLFSEQAAASECGMKNLASHQAKRSAAAALPGTGRRSKSKGQKTKVARWCIKSCLTSAGVAARGFLFHPRPRRTPAPPAASPPLATPPAVAHHLASLGRAGSRSERRLPLRKLQTALGFLGVVRSFRC